MRHGAHGRDRSSCAARAEELKKVREWGAVAAFVGRPAEELAGPIPGVRRSTDPGCAGRVAHGFHEAAWGVGVAAKERFLFIDQFRGLVGIMMALGHSSGYFNSVWKTLDMFDPLFSSFGQFALRYMGYLCAPGFLMMNGAVSWLTYQKRVAHGATPWQAKWHLIQRGLFLIVVQVLIVNTAWKAFRYLDLLHIGIISTIGITMCLLALFINLRWQFRLAIALVTFIVHPLLLRIPYNPDNFWSMVVMQTWVDAGDWNKYPVLPWFGLGVMGSVMASGWMSAWKTPRSRIAWSWGIGLGAIALAGIIRITGGFGNTFGYDFVGSYSFFLDQKYPPNVFHNLWFFGAVTFMVGTIHFIGQFAMPAVKWLGIVGRVPLFFYVMHITILSLVADRFGVFYRQGAVAASLIGWVALLAVMLPLAWWFGKVKAKTNNPILKLV